MKEKFLDALDLAGYSASNSKKESIRENGRSEEVVVPMVERRGAVVEYNMADDELAAIEELADLFDDMEVDAVEKDDRPSVALQEVEAEPEMFVPGFFGAAEKPTARRSEEASERKSRKRKNEDEHQDRRLDVEEDDEGWSEELSSVFPHGEMPQDGTAGRGAEGVDSAFGGSDTMPRRYVAALTPAVVVQENEDTNGTVAVDLAGHLDVAAHFADFASS